MSLSITISRYFLLTLCNHHKGWVQSKCTITFFPPPKKNHGISKLVVWRFKRTPRFSESNHSFYWRVHKLTLRALPILLMGSYEPIGGPPTPAGNKVFWEGFMVVSTPGRIYGTGIFTYMKIIKIDCIWANYSDLSGGHPNGGLVGESPQNDLNWA